MLSHFKEANFISLIYCTSFSAHEDLKKGTKVKLKMQC